MYYSTLDSTLRYIKIDHGFGKSYETQVNRPSDRMIEGMIE